MFERFTDRARRVVVLSQEEARGLGSAHIGTEHLLLGLLAEGEGLAATALAAAGIRLENVRLAIEAKAGPPTAPPEPEGPIPFSPEAKKVLELALRDALALGHNYIGTEHILLGLLREPDGLAAEVLLAQEADLDLIRGQVMNQMASVRPPGSPQSRGSGVAPSPPLTPAAVSIARRAARAAGAMPIGSHHYLQALLGDENSLASRLLAQLGVTRAEVDRRLEDMDPTGTSDEPPDVIGGRNTSVALVGDSVVVTVADAETAAALRDALSARGGTPAETLSVTGADPAASVAIRRLWTSLRSSVLDLANTLRRTPPPVPPPEAPPPSPPVEPGAA